MLGHDVCVREVDVHATRRMYVLVGGLCGVVREQQDQEATGAIDRGTEETHVTSINSIEFIGMVGWLIG